MFRRSRILALTAALFLALPAASRAATDPSNLSIAQLAAVDMVSTYLNDIRTLKGNFVQTAPNGEVTQGSVFIERPGKLRFEYAPPAKLRVVSDGSWVAIQDDRAGTNDRYPLSTTPLKLILKPNIDLMRDADIINVDPEGDLVTITLEESAGEAAGRLTLGFDPVANTLRQWTVTDVQGLDTTVQLQDVVLGEPIEDRYFRIVENRPLDVGDSMGR